MLFALRQLAEIETAGLAPAKRRGLSSLAVLFALRGELHSQGSLVLSEAALLFAVNHAGI